MVKNKLLSFICNTLERYSSEAGGSGEPDIFLVDVFVKGYVPSGRIEILVDTDAGISIAQCMSITRWLRNALEANEEIKSLVGDDYELVVSSPGIGEPIKHVRQYRRHMGRLLSVRYTDAGNVSHEIVGRLLEAEVLEGTAPFVVLEPVKTDKSGKKEYLDQVRLELSRISRAVVEVEF